MLFRSSQAAEPDATKDDTPEESAADRNGANAAVTAVAALPDAAAMSVAFMNAPVPSPSSPTKGDAAGEQRGTTSRSAPNVVAATLRTGANIGTARPGDHGQASSASKPAAGSEGPPPPVAMSDVRVAGHLAPSAAAITGVGVADGTSPSSGTDLPQATQGEETVPTGSSAAAQPVAAGLIGGMAPSQPASASIRSLANGIVDLARATADAAAKSVAGATSTSSIAAARTMTLQLAPADLGTVSVRLHLTGQSLDVQLSFSDSTTLSLVSHERDALAGALDRNGYQVASLVLQNTAPDQGAATPATSGSGDQGASMQASGGGADSQASGGGRMSRGGGGNGSDQPPAGARPQPRDPAAGLRDDRASGVFV